MSPFPQLFMVQKRPLWLRHFRIQPTAYFSLFLNACSQGTTQKEKNINLDNKKRSIQVTVVHASFFHPKKDEARSERQKKRSVISILRLKWQCFHNLDALVQNLNPKGDRKAAKNAPLHPSIITPCMHKRLSVKNLPTHAHLLVIRRPFVGDIDAAYKIFRACLDRNVCVWNECHASLQCM